MITDCDGHHECNKQGANWNKMDSHFVCIIKEGITKDIIELRPEIQPGKGLKEEHSGKRNNECINPKGKMS